MLAIQRRRMLLARTRPNSRFTRNWTTMNARLWSRLLGHFSWQPHIHGMEIGCFEGKSSLFFLRNVLQHETSSLTCIDPWPRPAFSQTIRPFRKKIRLIQRRSQEALRNGGFAPHSFEFIYIDGDHGAPSVLTDAVLSFPLLVPDGIMIFDDYLWQSRNPELPQSMPRIAIDAFLSVFERQVKVLHVGWQVAVQRI
jgi:predicted O-methyltransferase YrrM